MTRCTNTTHNRVIHRAIHRQETATDERGVYVVANHLSCGHRVDARRRRPPSGRTTAICYQCGSGPRRTVERESAGRRAEDALRAATREILSTPEGRGYVAILIRSCVLLSTMRPGDVRQEHVHREIRDTVDRCGLTLDHEAIRW